MAGLLELVRSDSGRSPEAVLAALELCTKAAIDGEDAGQWMNAVQSALRLGVPLPREFAYPQVDGVLDVTRRTSYYFMLHPFRVLVPKGKKAVLDIDRTHLKSVAERACLVTPLPVETIAPDIRMHLVALAGTPKYLLYVKAIVFFIRTMKAGTKYAKRADWSAFSSICVAFDCELTRIIVSYIEAGKKGQVCKLAVLLPVLHAFNNIQDADQFAEECEDVFAQKPLCTALVSIPLSERKCIFARLRGVVGSLLRESPYCKLCMRVLAAAECDDYELVA